MKNSVSEKSKFLAKLYVLDENE